MATQQAISIAFPPQAPAIPEQPAKHLMQVRAAHNHTLGVRTFYVASESQPNTEYVVQFIRRAHQRRWFCNCPDFTFRRLPRRRHCKHLHELTALAREAHGVSRLSGVSRNARRPLTFRVKSLTRPGVTYAVRYSNRKWTCDCPDAQLRNRQCKHIQILAVLGPKRAAELATRGDGR